ncbi:MAG: tetratricopeptide repeat protein [Turicibacter sp.]|nr:tetratricopeptide repeat protein [Turicibacter sp.]
MSEQTYQYYLNQKAVATHYLEIGNAVKALEHFNNAYQTPFGTEDLDLMLELAFLYDEIDDQKMAVQLFYDMIKLEPEFPTSYYGLATIYDNHEEYEKAIYYYQRTLELDPEYEAAHFFLANIYDELGDTKHAIEHYEKTLEIDPDYYYAYINLGCIYEAEDQNLKAYHYFYKAHQIDPTEYTALFNLGVACRKLGQVKEAIRYYRKSLTSNASYAYSYLNLALIYKEVYHEYEESIALYTEGIKHNPELSVLYYNRACCYALLNQNEVALHDIKMATAISPSLIDYMQKDDELIHVKQMPEYQELYSK